MTKESNTVSRRIDRNRCDPGVRDSWRNTTMVNIDGKSRRKSHAIPEILYADKIVTRNAIEFPESQTSPARSRSWLNGFHAIYKLSLPRSLRDGPHKGPRGSACNRWRKSYERRTRGRSRTVIRAMKKKLGPRSTDGRVHRHHRGYL